MEHFGINDHLWVQDVRSRVFSTLGQPNWLAAYLAILIPLALYQLHTHPSTLKKVLYLFLVFIFYLCLLFTKSKSGIFAAVSSVFIFYLLYFIRQKSKNLPLLALIFILFTSLSLIINNPIKDIILPNKLDISNSTLEINDLNITPSGEIRQIVWRGAFDLWRQHPLFGTGTETFAYSYYWTRPQEHNLTSEWDFLYNKAHNEYLNFLATTGIFGLGSYLFLIFSTLFYFFKKIITKNRPLLNTALMSAYLSILITNAFGFSVIITSLYFFLLPVFSYQTSTTPKIHFSKLQKYISFTFVIILGLYFAQKILYFYLADITYSQALSADNRQQYLQAKSYLNQSISYRPNEPTYHSKAAFINAKIALNNQENIEYQNQALKHLSIAAQISPFNTNIWKEQALTLFYLSTLDSKYFPLSIAALENVTRLAPTDAKTYYLIGKYYQASSDFPSSITAYQKAIDLKSNYDHAYFSLAQIQFEQKDYATAKINFQKALSLAPKNEEAKDYLDQIDKLLP
jgi:tetratricopeptide (TPR) repeat protein